MTVVGDCTFNLQFGMYMTVMSCCALLSAFALPLMVASKIWICVKTMNTLGEGLFHRYCFAVMILEYHSESRQVRRKLYSYALLYVMFAQQEAEMYQTLRFEVRRWANNAALRCVQ